MRFLTRRRSAARLAFLLLIAHCSLLIEIKAQAPKTYTSSEILLGLKKLNVLGSVLYIAAHPDDENTRLLAYLANERLVETAYLSLTRGDGGQNLIGPELGAGLGVIRTQELLAARRIDGARQFFTRANDFGFSKTAAETFTIWDREQVLADMVWVIRQRRPDVLITRFPPDARAGHGHHTASAMLAIDAFAAAGDAKRFPEQLQYVQPWSPKRLLWNTGSFFVKPGDDLSKLLKLDAGGYNPLLGQSYGEIAARSRSQHRSQGFGSAAQRGEALEYFQPLREGDTAPKELLEGVDMSWNRVTYGSKVAKKITEVIRKFDASNPAASLPELEQVNFELDILTMSRHPQLLMSGDDRFWVFEKKKEVDNLIAACMGVSIEATATQPYYSLGELVNINLDVVNRSVMPMTLIPHNGLLNGFEQTKLVGDTIKRFILKPGKAIQLKYSIALSNKQQVSQPYWLREKSSIGMYKLPDSVFMQQPNWGLEDRGLLVGKPENNSVATVYLSLEPYIVRNIPVQYKHTDPVLGEIYQPLAVVPPVAVNLPAARAYVFADQQAKTVPVTLRAGRAGVAGTLALLAPKGWDISPASAAFTLKSKDEEQTQNFQLRPGPGAAPGRFELKAEARLAPPSSAGEGGRGGEVFTRGIQTISYPHIPTQTLFPEAAAPLVKLSVSRGQTQQVGYLMGAGDEVPEALRQLGYTVTLLDPNTDLTADRLRRFDAVVLGVRAYNTVEQLKTRQPELLRYVEAGGNLVVQYVVTRGVLLPQIGPYPFTLSNDRVTVEGAPITFLNPSHRLLNAPNKITAADFQGWVQEQGLYYPSSWDPKYTPLISSADPGETPKQGAILVADYGKGHYIYTGLSFFRELPAGVPGAYRLLANLVSYGK